MLIGYGVFNSESMYRVRILCHETVHPGLAKEVRLMRKQAQLGNDLFYLDKFILEPKSIRMDISLASDQYWCMCTTKNNPKHNFLSEDWRFKYHVSSTSVHLIYPKQIVICDINYIVSNPFTLHRVNHYQHSEGANFQIFLSRFLFTPSKSITYHPAFHSEQRID